MRGDYRHAKNDKRKIQKKAHAQEASGPFIRLSIWLQLELRGDIKLNYI